MKQMVEFLARHGYWLLFLSVLCRQACLPVPTDLVLVAAGALAGLGRLNLAAIMLFPLAAFLLADTAWYMAGKKWGGRTLELICGASRDPAARVDKMSARFNHHGLKLLLVSKFIIGVDSVAAPMCGISRAPLPRFLLFDSLGAILWSSVYVALGYIFSDQLDRVAEYTARAGELLLVAGIAAVGILIILRLVHWYHFLRKFRLTRITPEQLKKKLDAGENVLVLDLQGDSDPAQELAAIPGAVRIDPRLLRQYVTEYRNKDLETGLEVILYCASPGDVTSARVALAMRQLGFENVRPLAGGLQAWRERKFPVTNEVETVPIPEHAVYALRELLQYSRDRAALLLKDQCRGYRSLLNRAIRRSRKTPIASEPSTSD